jgi:hypothetical protein
MSQIISGVILAVLIGGLSDDLISFATNSALAFVFYNASRAFMRKLESEE